MLFTNIAREIKKTFSRFIAIALIGALGVGFFGGLRTTNESMLHTADKYYKNQKIYDFKIQSQYGIKEDDIKNARELEKIKVAEGAYEVDAFIKNGTSEDSKDKEYVFHIISLTDNINIPDLKYGRMPENKYECVADFKNYTKKDIGKKIRISEDNDQGTKAILDVKEYEIVGIATSPIYLDFERGNTNLGLGKVDNFMYTMSSAFNSPVYTTLYMKMDKHPRAYSDEYNKNLKEAKKKIKEWKPEGSYLTDRKDNSGYSTYKENADILNGVAKIFPLFFLMVAVLVCMTTMARMIDDHRIQIGSLRALGYSSSSILVQYLFYSVTATLIGSVIGYIAGTHIFQSTIWNAYKTMYDFAGKSVYVRDLNFGLICIGISIASAVAATVFSCASELKEVPAKLVRPRAPKSGKRILLERIKPVWDKLGFLHKVPIRNVFRYKKRLIMMVIGIGGCTALLVAGFGIKTTIKNSVSYQYDNITKYDYRIFFKEDMNEARQAEFEKNAINNDEKFKDNDLKYIYMGNGELAIGGKKHDVDVSVTDEKDIRNFINLENGSQSLKFPKKGEIAVCRKLGDKYDIKAGDKIKIKVNSNELEVKVSGIFDNHINRPVILNRDTFENADSEKIEYNAAYVKKPSGLSVKEMRKQITEISKTNLASGAVINVDLIEKFDDMMNSLNGVVFLAIFSAGLLAFIVLYNLTNINIIERIREIATIKVLGFRNKEVSAYMYRENFILTLIGIIVGLPLGKLLLKFIILQIDVNSIYFVPKLMPRDYVISALLTILFTIIVSLAMYRKLLRVDMVESLKSAE